MEQIIIELIADTTKLAPALDILRKAGKITEDEEKALAALASTSNKAFNSANKAAASLIPTLEHVEEAVVILGEAAEEAIGDALGDAFDEAKKGAKDLGAGVNDLGDKVDKTETKAKSFKSELRALKEALAQMEAEGNDTGTTFEQMSIRAAQLEDQIGDTAERIRVLSSDTAGLDAGVEALQGLAGGFQFVTAAQELFGEGSEDVQKALVKLNSIMAISQSLQQAQNFIRGQSILKLKLEAAWQAIYSTAVGTSTGAMKMFRIAMLGLGIGAVVALVVLAVKAFNDYSNRIKEVSKSTKLLNDAIAQTGGEYQNAVRNVTELSQNIKLAKEGFLDKKEVLKQYNDTIGKTTGQVNNLKEAEQGLIDNAEAYIKMTLLKSAAQLALDEASKKVFEAEMARRKADEDFLTTTDKAVSFGAGSVSAPGFVPNLQTQATQTQIAFDKAQSKKRKDAAIKNIEDEKEAFLKSARELQQDAAQIAKDHPKWSFFGNTQDDLKNAKDAADKAKDLAKMNAAALAEIEKKRLEAQADESKQIAENDTLNFEVRYNAAKRYAELQTQLAENAEKIALKEAKTGGERKLAEFNKSQEIIKINSETATRIGKIWFDNRDKLVEIAKLPDIPDATKEQANELLKITDDRLKEEVKKIDDAEKKKLELLKKSISLAASYVDSALGSSSAGNVLKNALSLYEQLAEADQAFKEGQISREEKFQQYKNAIITTATASVMEVVNGFYANAASKRQAELDTAIANLEAQKERELNVENITQQQKDDISKRYAAKERALKLKAFEEDKKAKRAAAIINGLLAVTNALATAPTIIAGIALAAAAVVTTGIQVAKINSTTPGFKKGTKKAPRGYAWVGEEGPELVHLKGGEKIWTYNQSMKIAESWAGGSLRTPDEILSGYAAIPVSVPDDVISYNTSNNLQIDYDQLGKAVARNMPKIPDPVQNNISFDKNGMTVNLIKGISKTEIKNQKFKL